MTWSFEHPVRLWILLALLGLVGAYAFGLALRRRRAVRFSNMAILDQIGARRGGWGRHVLAGAQLLGLAVGIMAIAQPFGQVLVPKERATVVLALDTSLSMKATDVSPTRIASAKKSAETFVRSLPKKLNLGLVSFDGTSRVEVAPTTDRTSVIRAIKGLELHEGTAIGEAVKTSLGAIARVPKDETGKKAPGVIVLLSDGSTTMGTPTSAAGPLARKAGVPVWTIAYGTPEGVVNITLPETGQTQAVQVPVDGAALAELATQTSGKSFTAESASDLSSVYSKLGGAIGYDKERHDLSWRYFVVALALMGTANLLAAAFFQRVP